MCRLILEFRGDIAVGSGWCGFALFYYYYFFRGVFMCKFGG